MQLKPSSLFVKTTRMICYPHVFNYLTYTVIGLTSLAYIFTYFAMLERFFIPHSVHTTEKPTRSYKSSPNNNCSSDENIIALEKYNLTAATASANALINFINLGNGEIDPHYFHLASTKVFNLKSHHMSSAECESAETDLYKTLLNENITIMNGGYHISTDSLSAKASSGLKYGITIVVPYRNRTRNLFVFLGYIHRFLALRGLTYHIVLAEQVDVKLFNRAKLFNAVLTEMKILKNASKENLSEEHPHGVNFIHCIVFHDVDKLPMNFHSSYACNGYAVQLLNIGLSFHRHGRQMKLIKKRNGLYEHLYYPGFFGGVTAVTSEIILKVNGFSNIFYGWGGEDDDFRMRLEAKSVPIEYTQQCKGRFYLVEHPKDAVVKLRRRQLLHIINVTKRMQQDGLREVYYVFLGKVSHKLYTVYRFQL